MQYCGKCRIKIQGNKRCCPLCQGELTGEPSPAPFPSLQKEGRFHLPLGKFFTFLLVALEIIMTAIWFLSDFQLAWVPFVMLGALVVWLYVALGLYFKNNIVKNITIQVYLVMIISYVVDRCTHFHGWSVEWVIPCCFVGLVVATVCIGKGIGLALEEYILYLAVDMILSLSQVAFLAAQRNNFVWPAVISLAFLLILGAAALIFRFRDLKNAAERLFHM